MRGRKEHYEPTPVFSQFDSPRGLVLKNSLNAAIELSPPCLLVVNRLSLLAFEPRTPVVQPE
jgi:hypothetical protein